LSKATRLRPGLWQISHPFLGEEEIVGSYLLAGNDELAIVDPGPGSMVESLLASIREAGFEHSILSTDLGQVFNPPVEDGMGIMVDRLLAAGFSDEEVHVMAVVNSRRVAGAQPR